MSKMNNFEVLTLIGTMIDSLNFEDSMSQSMHWSIIDNGFIVYTMDKEQTERFIEPLLDTEKKLDYTNAALIFEDIERGYEITKVVLDTGEAFELDEAIHNIYYGDVLEAYYSLCSSLVCVVSETV